MLALKVFCYILCSGGTKQRNAKYTTAFVRRCPGQTQTRLFQHIWAFGNTKLLLQNEPSDCRKPGYKAVPGAGCKATEKIL